MTAASGRTGGRRRGRPAAGDRAEGEPGTRDRILASARAEFSRRGYDKASIRAIARGADVDPALVHHYFGSKEQVFAAAVEMSMAPARRLLEQLPLAAPAELGERLTRFFLGVWQNPATRAPLLAVIRSAVNNETAARIFREMVERYLMSYVARVLEVPDRELRVELAAAQLVGTVMMRYVIKVEPLASAPLEELITRIAPVVQHHLVGPGPGSDLGPTGTTP